MNDFKVLAISRNRLLIKYGAISFYVFVDILNGKQVINKPKSIFIDREEYIALIRLVKDEYIADLVLTGDRNANNS